LLYFLILTSTIMAQWQRRETVMLVSRGMNLRGVLSLTLFEQVLLFLVGYPLGMAFGMFVARLMGNTNSFLSFTSRPPLPVSLEGFNLPLTLLALGFALFSRLLPALQAARSSLVTEERERARPMHKPLWFRAYLDLLLLFPTVYAYDQMVKRGSLAGLVTDRPEDLYRDPLLVVVPALFILTTSLVSMRVFAILMRLLDLLAGRVPWLTLHLAVRQLGRQSLDYIRPLLLVVIALAMGVYTLAMAASLDQWTVDRVAYRTGADLVITPAPEDPAVQVVDGSWIPLPQDFRAVPGIETATRVGDYDMLFRPPGGGDIRGRFLAVDRADFAAAAWFRDDFAGEPLGALMNRLALVSESILVSEEFLQKRGYKVGDILTIRVDIENFMSVSSEFIIAGAYRYFPTVYDNEITFIGSLDAIALMTGVTPAHQVWMRLAPGFDSQTLLNDVQTRLRFRPAHVRDMRALVREEQERKERVGIFGTLTVSFLATAVMAVLGLLIYSYASLQERSYRLAVLNAVGLSRRQILAQVTLEYAFLALFGVLGGALIGQAAAALFVPFFRYTGEIGAPLPPLLPIVTGAPIRNLSLIFGSTIIIVEVVSMASILHNRLVQILKRVWM
jgi:putative ABC transport system permease protein